MMNKHDYMKKKINDLKVRLDVMKKEITPIDSRANQIFADDFLSLEEVSKEISSEVDKLENFAEDSRDSLRYSAKRKIRNHK